MANVLNFFTKSEDIDFSYDLRDVRDWNTATIREVEFLSNVTALAYEPVQGFFAVGTRNGRIAIFGSQAVGRITKLPTPAAVVSLHFASLVFKLLCVDQRGNLHVWDLSVLSGPMLQVTEKFDEGIQCICVSPSHSHALIALQSGSIITYDLLCLCRSPYVIPCVWKSHEEKVEGSMPVPPVPGSRQLMEMAFHPRDLNIVFLAYIGGVAIYNLSTRTSVRHFDFVLPPGAPGGQGYTDPSILQPRRQALTCMTIHPSGHIFATGYTDGCIAFWAVADEDKPVLVRTVNEVNVDVADAQKLSTVLDQRESNPNTQPQEYSREPIFKLSWSGYGNPSDPYGYTTLCILGGLRPSDVNGISTICLRPFKQASPSTPTRQAIHPNVRREMESFLDSTDVYTYTTDGPTQDFLLIPRNTPHLGGVFDPTAIVLLSEVDGDSRGVQAKEFPPPEFVDRISGKTTSSPAEPTNDDNTVDILASTLQELQLSREPADITLAMALWTGVDAILDGDLVRMDDDAHARLLRDGSVLNAPGISRGGVAWVDYGSEGQNKDLRWTKYQAHRLLVTHQDNLTIRFMDVSPQLLMGSSDSPLPYAYPAPMIGLTISVCLILSAGCIVSHNRPVDPEECAIQSVQLTSETLECAVALRSGHVVIYSFAEEERVASHQVRTEDEEVIPLDHLPEGPLRFQPKLFVDNKYGNVTVCELSNIGFLAIAYTSGALIIIDMRHPKIILRDNIEPKTNKRHSFPLHRAHDPREVSIQSMKWFVCGYDSDAAPRVRLIASYRNGETRVFTIYRTQSAEYIAQEESKKPEGLDRPLPRGMFVLNAKNGSSCQASRDLFAGASVHPNIAAKTTTSKDETHCYWIVAGSRGVKCSTNIAGGKSNKVEWGKSRTAESVEVINRSGAQALVAIMSTRDVLVYALPSLEELHTFQLPINPDSAISLDDTGDYVDWTFDMRRGTVIKATLGTLFAIRRVYDEPVVDFASGRKQVPAIPASVPLGPQSILGSWFRMNLNTSVSGDQIDALLAGPNRPIPEETSTIVNNQWQRQIQSRAQSLANQGSRVGSDIYNNLSNAVTERGELLSGLEDRFRSLGEGGRKMVFEAKRLAAEQSAKRWLG